MFEMTKEERRKREKREKEITKTADYAEDLLIDLETSVSMKDYEEVEEFKGKLINQINKLANL